MRSILTGQQVNISYGPLKDNKFNRRQRKSKNNYHFICQLCVKEAHSLTSLKCGHSMVCGITDKNEKDAFCFECNQYYQNAKETVETINNYKV